MPGVGKGRTPIWRDGIHVYVLPWGVHSRGSIVNARWEDMYHPRIDGSHVYVGTLDSESCKLDKSNRMGRGEIRTPEIPVHFRPRLLWEE